MTEEQRQMHKEEAILLALRNDIALIRRDLEIWGMKRDGSTALISKSGNYQDLWIDALRKLREVYGSN